MKSRTLTKRREGVSRPPPVANATKRALGKQNIPERLADLVLSLREPYRSIVILRFFTNLSPEEIAEKQSLHLGTVERRIRRGLESLREGLDREFGRAEWAEGILPYCLSAKK